MVRLRHPEEDTVEDRAQAGTEDLKFVPVCLSLPRSLTSGSWMIRDTAEVSRRLQLKDRHLVLILSVYFFSVNLI
jgi:hypothetical protein